MLTIERFVAIAEELGWRVSEEDKENEKEFVFAQYSDAGQDFSVELTIRNNDAKSLINELSRYVSDFDVSEETYKWLDHTGHGKNGAPYDMIDVYKDMEECVEMMEELLSYWMAEALIEKKKEIEQ